LSNQLVDSGHLPPSLVALGHVLSEARALIGQSPSQVGGATGLSGRTIRRLEAALIQRPHTTTLEALAQIYALAPDVLHQMVAWSELDAAGVLAALTRLDESAPADMTLEQRAMRLARRGFDDGGSAGEASHPDPEVAEILEHFLALDRRRRTHVRLLLHDLRAAAERERAQGGVS
jgi:transcriptional regulator with XRE-family HTH domain